MRGGSVWAPLAKKVAGYAAGLLALALVGSGGLARLIPGAAGGSGAELALLYGGAAGGNDAGVPGDAGAGERDTHETGAAGEAGEGPTSPEDGGAPTAAGGVTADGKVVLNLATAEDLRRLPGVGPSKAAAILALRAKLKRFSKVDELLRVKGIGRRSLKRLRPLVVVDPP